MTSCSGEPGRSELGPVCVARGGGGGGIIIIIIINVTLVLYPCHCKGHLCVI